MRNLADHRTTGVLGASRLAITLFSALALAGIFLQPAAARPDDSAYCQNLRAQIARSGGERASGRQSAELRRLQYRAHAIGCGRGAFLIFGPSEPAECGGLQSRIAQLSSVASPTSGGYWGGSDRSALLARYDAECRHGDRAARQAEPSNIFEALFGMVPRRDEPTVDGPGGGVLNPGDPDGEYHAQGGSEAICVRQCDGGFFPVSYSAHHGNLQDLNSLCQAQCPNAEAAVFTKSLWRDVDTAVSMDGQPYMSLPNALKFQKQRNAACSCKPPDVSWAQALEGAERLLSFERHHDSILTAEEAERLSRPLPIGGASRRVANGQTRRDTRVIDAVASPPAESAAAGVGLDQGVYRQVTGPDGATKRVRVIDPAL
ncbi:DUF2865 domain-containing protein [Methylocystis bryophila]|uniref:DUF2865 domain-containing protein n=1 Tax=Methylocystis bryophila TaxID=655015 RepID=A0A1W6MZS5_9HYPH|nr:DUF2865 domain-containing protein [Methylocystis bryophila]ARN83088.1 hypothetical protein B1812_20640 [Methylocystis bryophila]BDV39404.1 hypothetical protein DSM21852_26570 [Methylocystis bryophila]